MSIEKYLIKIYTKEIPIIGSGVLLNLRSKNHTYVLTARHCLFDEKEKKLKYENGKVKILWEENPNLKEEITIDNDKILISQQNDDVMILRINHIKSIDYNNLEISYESCNPPLIGSEIRIFFYYQGDGGKEIQSLKGEFALNQKGKSFYKTGLPSHNNPKTRENLAYRLHGASGSPITHDDKIIAIHNAAVNEDAFNFTCIPIRKYLELLRENEEISEEELDFLKNLILKSKNKKRTLFDLGKGDDDFLDKHYINPP